MKMNTVLGIFLVIICSVILFGCTKEYITNNCVNDCNCEGVYEFDADNIMCLLAVNEQQVFWHDYQSHGSEQLPPSYYIDYLLHCDKIRIEVDKNQFYGINAVYFDRDKLKRYIAENDIVIIKHYKEYKLKYNNEILK